MSPQSLNEYTEVIAKRYKRAVYKSKQELLNEYCQVTGFHRKHAIRKLNSFKFFQKPKKHKRGRKAVYNQPKLLGVLKKIWLTANLPCSKLLKALLPAWLPHYAKTFEPIDSGTLLLLEKISPATIDRIFKPARFQYHKKGRSGTKPGSLLRNQIPIQTDQWNQAIPGFLESDTVHHCGDNLAGQYVLTVNYTDIATGWTEQRAVWGKGETGVLEQTGDVERSLPFCLRGFDTDNGGEFINYHLYKYLALRKGNPVQFTRSRAYKKNDNSHIEQKNWTHVRQWFGYGRFDNPKIVELLNNLYTSEWRLFHNFFIPSVKLIDKQRDHSKIIKKFDKPKTPLERVLMADDSIVTFAKKEQLKSLYQSLNPFNLRKNMEIKIAKVLRLASKTGNINSDSTNP
ncbi:MAG: integrase [Thermoproteota archaeon]